MSFGLTLIPFHVFNLVHFSFTYGEIHNGNHRGLPFVCFIIFPFLVAFPPTGQQFYCVRGSLDQLPLSFESHGFTLLVLFLPLSLSLGLSYLLFRSTRFDCQFVFPHLPPCLSFLSILIQSACLLFPRRFSHCLLSFALLSSFMLPFVPFTLSFWFVFHSLSLSPVHPQVLTTTPIPPWLFMYTTEDLLLFLIFRLFIGRFVFRPIFTCNFRSDATDFFSLCVCVCAALC